MTWTITIDLHILTDINHKYFRLCISVFFIVQTVNTQNLLILLAANHLNPNHHEMNNTHQVSMN